MDVRSRFRSASKRLRDGFNDTRPTRDSRGKGTQREQILADELAKVLPTRYSLGQGEVVTFQNRASLECDIVIYNASVCPKLVLDAGHAVYPYETVYGVVQVKSELNAAELERAYKNIASVKSIVPNMNFTVGGAGFVSGFGPPRPVGVVFAYSAGRTLETVAQQVRTLDASLPDTSLRPDFIAILDEGIIGPTAALRESGSNRISWPSVAELNKIRPLGIHTWMRFCLQLTRELNSITLPPFELLRYLQMPDIVKKHRVRNHDRFARGKGAGAKSYKLTESAIEKIVADAVGPMMFRDYLSMKHIPNQGMSEKELDAPIWHYSPQGVTPPAATLPAPAPPAEAPDAAAPPPAAQPAAPRLPAAPDWPVFIDGQTYYVNLASLEEDDLVETDVPVADFFE
ncbi:uncharacterized protein SOCEGT47_014500 [Sorangium cellulosum]|uniref:DUF6602 domain-containing protein n=1 Tax=Sorangium cellulosum TaxID=56 RepID=A0A4V0ND03_SORCE|nr:DUF6602 domain-containing protein [Sorangium cellulosum]AUX20972.1 uncharacterized protein SOCEGT47_014500 [Sorangium cellulosum]